MNNETFLIENDDLEIAKDICKYIETPVIRNRAVANTLGAKLASKYFTDFEIDTQSGLHNVIYGLSKYEISDIYINGVYIDVRITFEEDELYVPQSHFENNLLPIAYMFIKIDENLSGGTVLGFALPDSINTSESHQGYYKVDIDSLISFYDVEPYLISNYDTSYPENFEKMVFDYLDNKAVSTNELFKILINSKDARFYFQNAIKTKQIFKFVSVVEVNEENDKTSPLETLESSSDLDLETSYDNTLFLEETDNDTFLEEQDSELLVDNDIDFEPIEELSLSQDSSIESLELENAKLDIEPEDNIDIIDNSIEIVEPLDEIEVDDSSEEILNLDDSLMDDNTDNNFIEIGSQPLEIPETVIPEDLNKIEEELSENDSSIESFEDLAVEDFSTNITPSFNNIDLDEKSEIENDVDDTLAYLLEESDANQNSTENDIESEIIEDEDIVNETIDKKIEDSSLDVLYNQNEAINNNDTDDYIAPKKNSILPFVFILAIIGSIGYFAYSKFFNNPEEESKLPKVKPPAVSQKTAQPVKKQTNDAMPIETVENIKKVDTPTNEGTSVSIPMIENNLDASILVSNLSVNWEVPSGYLSSNTAKRYFTKLGKIIQLNLKTEMLLLSKPPITNKIVLELEFNSSNNKFDVKGITMSSGEKVVDDLVIQTVKNALELKTNINTNVFGSIQGNPSLVINL